MTDMVTEITFARKKIPAKVKNTFHALGTTYHQHVPLDAIFENCESIGLTPIMEDGEPWKGFLCGEDGQCVFQLAHDNKLVKNLGLSLSWHKMQSGRYEVVTYIN